ncbi:MAG: YceH family protein [Bacteroidota bacterium]
MEILSHEETRIIGSLIEKENTTPEYYPMTINALTNACNQKSSRNPVVNYDEMFVEETTEKLREKGFATKVTGAEYRVPKFRQLFSEYYKLSLPETAALCVLFLRGPQTVGEIRGRTSRIYNFADLTEVDLTLEKLIKREDGPFVIKLPRDSGRERRFTHLFCGEPKLELTIVDQEEDKLELRITALENELKELKEEFLKFKKAFD